MTRYTIRYRYGDGRGRSALIVDDGRGNAYLVSSGALQVRLAGDDASARLADILRRSAACAPLAEVAPYSPDDPRSVTTLTTLPGTLVEDA